MGIGGSGISGIALLAKEMGYEVSGCDLEKDTAYLPKIRKFIPRIFVGHSQSHLTGVDLLVVSPAIFFQNKKHPEVLNAPQILTWQEFLGRYLHQGKKVVAIAGTHGKSTVTAMTSLLFEKAGLDPTCVVGATVPTWRENVRFGKGNYFITEADEFYDNFLNYHPEAIILNAIEFDHPDFFASEEQLLTSYASFLKNLKGEKILIVNQDSSGIKRVFDLLGKEFLSTLKIYGYSLGAPLFETPESISAKVSKASAKGTTFKLNDGGEFSLRVPGVHNVSNSLGVILLARVLGIKEEFVKESLSAYAGIGRRLELLGEKRGIKVYDDYAHHPTAIAATLQALRQLYPQKRIWAVVEAHSYSRTKALLASYKGVFKDADEVVIGPIFKARDLSTFGITEESMVDASQKKNARATNSLEKVLDLIKKGTREGDVILVMGAGKSYDWSRKILASL